MGANKRSTDEDPLSRLLAPPANETPEERDVRLRLEAEARQISDRIDEQLKAERAALKKNKPVKVLLLGQSESGASCRDPVGLLARWPFNISYLSCPSRKIYYIKKYVLLVFATTGLPVSYVSASWAMQRALSGELGAPLFSWERPPSWGRLYGSSCVGAYTNDASSAFRRIYPALALCPSLPGTTTRGLFASLRATHITLVSARLDTPDCWACRAGLLGAS